MKNLDSVTQEFNDLLLFKLAQIESANEELVPMALVKRLSAGEPPVLVWREHRGLAPDALARKASVTPETLQAIESGSAEGNLRTMSALARALRIDLEDLVPWPQDTDGPS
ncbi:MAG: helix-turn-helix transcriptional regulator [Acidisphaera sp.]|nr:helix-turn-helix transcriptional regulator [Acidisphaera sp.]